MVQRLIQSIRISGLSLFSHNVVVRSMNEAVLFLIVRKVDIHKLSVIAVDYFIQVDGLPQ